MDSLRILKKTKIYRVSYIGKHKFRAYLKKWNPTKHFHYAHRKYIKLFRLHSSDVSREKTDLSKATDFKKYSASQKQKTIGTH